MRRRLYLGNDIPIGGTAPQEATARFGTDPTRTGTALNCKAQELDNRCIADTGFPPSIGAANPPLATITNAPRVG